ncbi:solute carrier family 26 member 6, like [Pimephales promelas]|uniref:solute carrier family 26 member 6, like n=1 Tax=Pimephales promelas TaxID=90988 RepID=UPI0019556773|nr:solute carrier family 26 member 6, like [Pimephales promelas]KAG1942691.1 solute carrier family [Pimephales promelas]
MDSRNAEYCIQREVIDEQRLKERSRRLDHSQTNLPISHWLKKSLSCSVPKLKRTIVGFLPVLSWLPRYSIWDYGMPDLISGISVGIMHLPQGMAYALLASLPPVFGLYTSLYPPFIYFIFGTSRHISIGTFTILSIMIGSVTERLAPDADFLIYNGTNVTEEVDIVSRDLYRVQVAAATTVLGGLIQVVLGLVQFGFVGTYLSEPLVRGYTTAASAHAVVAQLKYILGVSPKRFNGPLSIVYTLIDLVRLLPETHLPTLLASVVAIVVLITAKELNNALRHKMLVPIPVELCTIVVATVISFYTRLNESYKISVVGEIPSGLQPPGVPNTRVFSEVVVDAFAIAIVGYAISISLGKTFALKHGYKVESNQELVALGLSNTVGGFFHCFSVCSSMSRSLIQETTGGKTQIAGVVSGVIVLVTVLKLGSLFQELPKAVLAAIVFVNLKGMFKQYYDIVTLWRSCKIDLLIWLVTYVSTVLFNLDMGLGASMGFALLTVIFRTQRPSYSLLGHLPGTELYLDMETHEEVREVPGITIFRSSATMYFANAELYLEALKKKSGLDIGKMLTYKRRQEAKQRRRERRAERRARREAKRQKRALREASQRSKKSVFTVEDEVNGDMHREVELGWRQRENSTVFVIPETARTSDGCHTWMYLKGTDPETATLGSVSDLHDGDTTTLDSSSEDTLSRDLERVSLGSLGKWTWDIHSIILDFSTANFVDTVAIKTLRNIFHDFGEIDVNIYLAGCQALMVEQLERGGFFSDVITEGRVFATVHDAVLYCLKLRGAVTIHSYENALDISGTRL